MREIIAEWTFGAYAFVLPFAWIGVAVAIFVLFPMALIRSTRSAAGLGLFFVSWIFGATTWLLGAGVTFASFGWLGLFIGLILFGIGVVPLAIIAAFFKLGEPGLGVSLIVMAILVIATRMGGMALAESTSPRDA